MDDGRTVIFAALIDQLLDERRPGRYTVDAHGHAPWMDDVIAEACRILRDMPLDCQRRIVADILQNPAAGGTDE